MHQTSMHQAAFVAKAREQMGVVAMRSQQAEEAFASLAQVSSDGLDVSVAAAQHPSHTSAPRTPAPLWWMAWINALPFPSACLPTYLLRLADLLSTYLRSAASHSVG